MKQQPAWLGLLLGIMLLGGCAAPDTPEQVHLHDALQGWVEIESLSVNRAESGLLEVSVTGRNRLDSVLLMSYEFDWLDAEGHEIETELSRRMPASADGLRHFTIRGVAPKPAATDFRLYIKERRP